MNAIGNSALILTMAGLHLEAQTVNWVGGNLYKLWNDSANWSPAVVPTNRPGFNYTVIVPATSIISYLGLALAKGVGETFAQGRTQLLRLRFVPSGQVPLIRLEFGDVPVTREIVDAWAGVLDATYRGATIEVRVGPQLGGTVVRADGSFEFSFTAESGSAWIIEVSSDLRQWSDLARRIAVDGTLQFADENGTRDGQRFYRVRQAE